jgi:hypothetical protein
MSNSSDIVTEEDMDNIALQLSVDEIMMFDISEIHQDICAMWYKRKVFLSELVYRMLSRAIADGMTYARIRATKYEPFKRMGALYHVLQCSRKRVIYELGNNRATFRCMLRMNGRHHLLILATIRNKQQVMIITTDELKHISK